MNCPVCGKQMVQADFGGVLVDVCRDGCKGIWFDWTELGRLDENNEGAGEALKDALESSHVNDENRQQLKCPKCGLPMHVHKYKNAKEVNVDECYGCGGFFLDSGELGRIKDSFMSEAERDAYVDKLISETPEGKAMEQETERMKARPEACSGLGRILNKRFLS